MKCASRWDTTFCSSIFSRRLTSYVNSIFHRYHLSQDTLLSLITLIVLQHIHLVKFLVCDVIIVGINTVTLTSESLGCCRVSSITFCTSIFSRKLTSFVNSIFHGYHLSQDTRLSLITLIVLQQIHWVKFLVCDKIVGINTMNLTSEPLGCCHVSSIQWMSTIPSSIKVHT